MARKGGRGFGIIGLGMISEFHAKAMRAMRGGHLSCAFSRTPNERARKFADEYGVTVYTGDFKAFLAHPGLDVVTVATPSGAHLEPAAAAARAGKHVVCEKPLETTLERCDRMIAACKRAGVLLGGIFPSRTLGAVQEMKRAVRAGRFGKLTVCSATIPWHRPQSYYDGGGWRGTWKLDGGGALMNQAIHTVDLLQWLAGPVAEIQAAAGCLAHRRIEVEDSAVAALRFKNGALGLIAASTAMWPGAPREVRLSGERGSAWLRDDCLERWDFDKETPRDRVVRRKFGTPKAPSGKGGAADPRAISFVGFQIQFENFVRCLDGKERLLVDGREARKAVELVLAVYKAARGGRRVVLPLKRTPPRGFFGKK